MKLTLQKGDILETACDLLVLSEFEGGKGTGGAIGIVDKKLGGYISKVIDEEQFEAKSGSTLLLRLPPDSAIRRVLVVGLGNKKEVSEETVRQAAAVALNATKGLKSKKVMSALLGAEAAGVSARQIGKAMAEGILLAAYDFAKYKSGPEDFLPDTFTILAADAKSARLGSDGFALGEVYANATILARDLVNEPAQHMRPIDLVNAAKRVAAASKGKIRIKIFDREELKKMGAGGILGIARGSDHEPFLVHMIYKPTSGKAGSGLQAGKAKKRVALVGKAITFDTGGISLKPSDAMMTMKLDMAGAAAVIGAFSALGALSVHTETHGIFGACENMPSGKAIVPGDIVRAMNNKTIEVLNTDAEGRVTLADTLTYALKMKPDIMLDLATLTGACMVALGEEIAGVMSNDRAVVDRVMKASQQAGENMWELPLSSEYKKLLKSEVADLKNIAGKYGGAITAGLFLQEFVGETPWAHLDIAGPAFAEKPINSYIKHGGTGFGVRTLLEFLRSF